MNSIPSQIPTPSFNNSNLTKMYFSPNITDRPKPSFKPSPSFIPIPSVVVARPSYKVYPLLNNATKKNTTNVMNVTNATKMNNTISEKLSTIKNINSYSRSITSSSSNSPTPTSSPIKSFRTNHLKYTYTQIGFLAFIIFLFYLCVCRMNRFNRAEMKKKVDIKVPIDIPEENFNEGASARITPPRSGGKSPRFMTVQKDCEV